MAKQKVHQAERDLERDATRAATELLLIRHAPSVPAGSLYGRTDVDADVSQVAKLAALGRATGAIDQWYCSPAKRCAQTARAIVGDEVEIIEDANLWEQDFGAWDGLALCDVPDLGALTGVQLMRHRPPGGESFADVCARVQPVLEATVARHPGQRVGAVVHAGVIRAALAMVVGGGKMPDASEEAAARALAFDMQPMSLTRLTFYASDAISIGCTNWCPVTS